MTLLEVLIVMSIIAVLCVALAMGYGEFRRRAERAKCTTNLKNLHVALAASLTDRQTWPQCPLLLGEEGYDEWWLAELTPYKIGKESWQCPSIKAESDPKATADDFKIHYIPTPFDEHAHTPFRWATQPWLVEIGDSHGDGNLVIFPDGSVRPFNDIIQGQR